MYFLRPCQQPAKKSWDGRARRHRQSRRWSRRNGGLTEQPLAPRTLPHSSQTQMWHQFPNHHGSDCPSHPSTEQSRWGSVTPHRGKRDAKRGCDSPDVTRGCWGVRPAWDLNRTAKTPFLLSVPQTAPPRMSAAFCPQGTLGFHSGPAAPQAQGSNPRAGEAWDPVSRAQPRPSFLTPSLAAGVSTQMARPGATLSLYFLSLP